MNLTEADTAELLWLHAKYGHAYVISTNGEVSSAAPVDDLATVMTSESAEELRQQLAEDYEARTKHALWRQP